MTCFWLFGFSILLVIAILSDSASGLLAVMIAFVLLIVTALFAAVMDGWK